MNGSAGKMMMGDAQDGHMGPQGTSDDETMEGHLMQLLAGLSDDDVNELAALAEAMHADGGM